MQQYSIHIYEKLLYVIAMQSYLNILPLCEFKNTYFIITHRTLIVFSLHELPHLTNDGENLPFLQLFKSISL